MQRLILVLSIFGFITATNECTFNADPEPPSVPLVVAANSTDSKVDFTWSKNTESDFSGYNVYKSEESFSDISFLQSLNGSDLYADTLYVDEQVTNGTTYYYRVTSVDINGNESNPSDEIKLTPFTNPPTRPN